ncbi:hypothetical protein SAMN05216345_10564 [Cupriavidus sp. YR651]|uniref:hypothetical protein n=1 Tax=Cupriavidus sp. YR651 TaxID=1855315 RepID=UPI00088C7CEB|nr:hypothetical protein [Cupriavidus sp. YR651]SDC98167.1 hypothetical protein SAMN05216345_10564 [Cupriavidus sp. YR651]
MEHLIRVQNEYDRQVLGWLRGRIADAALLSAARRAASDGKKPYLSTICRMLNIRPPSRRAFADEARHLHRAVGEQYLEKIRQILGQPAAGREKAGHEARPQGSLF